jgi:hypothetical protein
MVAGMEEPAVRPRAARRKSLALVVTAACIVLIPWTVFLATSLPRRYTASHWRIAWIGLDVVMIGFLARTAWLALERRTFVISAVITGTLLAVDAWFDVTTASGSTDRLVSLSTAILGELPLAAVLFYAARRMMRSYAPRTPGSGTPDPAATDPAAVDLAATDPAGSGAGDDADSRR